MTSRRKFIQGAAIAQPQHWRLRPGPKHHQMADADLCGLHLCAEVIVPAIEMFNKIAGDRMQIELFFADQIVPTGELFQAMQRGTIDAFNPMTIQWHPQRTSQFLAVTSHLARAILWTCLCCSTNTV